MERKWVFSKLAFFFTATVFDLSCGTT
jgi:hypothetical protein